MDPAVIALLIRYGPMVIGLLTKAAPIIEELTKKGMSHHDAAAAVLGAAEEHITTRDWDVRSDESKRLDPTGGSFQGP